MIPFFVPEFTEDMENAAINALKNEYCEAKSITTKDYNIIKVKAVNNELGFLRFLDEGVKVWLAFATLKKTMGTVSIT